MSKSNLVQIREAAFSNQDTLLRLSEKFNSDNPSSNQKKRLSDIESAISEGHLWIALREGKTAGYVLCKVFPTGHRYFPRSIFIAELFVLPDYRGQRIGEQLIKQAFAGHYPEECATFSLTHDPDKEWLNAYYEQLGFQNTGKTEAGNVMMVRPRTSQEF